MISAKLIELIEIHAERLTADVAQDLHANERTRAFRAVPIGALKQPCANGLTETPIRVHGTPRSAPMRS